MGTERDRDKKAEREKQMEGIRETEREGGGKAKEREGRDGEGEREGLLSGELKWGRGRGRRDMLPSSLLPETPWPPVLSLCPSPAALLWQWQQFSQSLQNISTPFPGLGSQAHGASSQHFLGMIPNTSLHPQP